MEIFLTQKQLYIRPMLILRQSRNYRTPLCLKLTCFSFISCTCMVDMSAAIIKPITTIMSLSSNLLSPPLSVSVYNHRLPALSSDWQPLWRLWSLRVSDMRGSKATALLPSPPSELLLIQHLTPPITTSAPISSSKASRPENRTH